MMHTEDTIVPGPPPWRGKLVGAMLRCLQQTCGPGRAHVEPVEEPEWRADQQVPHDPPPDSPC